MFVYIRKSTVLHGDRSKLSVIHQNAIITGFARTPFSHSDILLIQTLFSALYLNTGGLGAVSRGTYAAPRDLPPKCPLCLYHQSCSRTARTSGSISAVFVKSVGLGQVVIFSLPGKDGLPSPLLLLNQLIMTSGC